MTTPKKMIQSKAQMHNGCFLSFILLTILIEEIKKKKMCIEKFIYVNTKTWSAKWSRASANAGCLQIGIQTLDAFERKLLRKIQYSVHKMKEECGESSITTTISSI